MHYTKSHTPENSPEISSLRICILLLLSEAVEAGDV